MGYDQGYSSSFGKISAKRLWRRYLDSIDAEMALLPMNIQSSRQRPQEPNETPLEAFASICTVLVLGLFAFAFIFQNFQIPSGSMKNTLLVGDHVVVDRTTLAPPTKWAKFVHYCQLQRRDIIVFYKPNPETPDLILVKRAIGFPGDRIRLRGGILYLNGVAQNEPYTVKPNESNDDDRYTNARDNFPTYGPPESPFTTFLWTLQLPSHVQNGDVVVPDGYVFAMGDNRPDSADSRFWGFVPRENILGRPMLVYWSFKTPDEQDDKNSMSERLAFVVHTIIHFFDGTRWTRTFHIVR